MELLAQGVANIGSALFGGIMATGTVARTATNVRAGARGPLAGMFHAVFIILFMLVAAPLASYIPLAGLAGVLVVVAWGMVEKQAIITLLRSSRGDALVLAITFGLTVFMGLTEAIVVGFALGTLLFIHRMATATTVVPGLPAVAEDVADEPRRDHYDARLASNPDIAVYRISGAFFFGAAATVGAVLDRIADRHRVFIVDFSNVPMIDSTAANAIEVIASKAARGGVKLMISGAAPQVKQLLVAHGVRTPEVTYEPTLDRAVAAAESLIGHTRSSEAEA
jgi:SulP family sulfate permease